MQTPLGSAAAEGAQDARCSQVRQHQRGATAVEMTLQSQLCSRMGVSGPPGADPRHDAARVQLTHVRLHAR